MVDRKIAKKKLPNKITGKNSQELPMQSPQNSHKADA